MCGIAGFFGTTEVSPDQVRKCLISMEHRGPDANGTFRHRARDGRHVLLLHSRLTILDFDDRSNQPFSQDDQTLSFNGEIYNFVEVRETLRQQGVSFKTTSDTEVLAQALSHWGEDALDKLEGMWAFASFDQGKDRFILCRDRFGEKPLYIYQAEEGIYFGSEVQFIFDLLGKRLPVNHDHILRHMINGYRSLYKRENSYFLGIKSIAPGTFVSIDSQGRSEINRYWNPTYKPQEDMSLETAIERTREALIESVRLRLRADTPLSFCMSGGIDSNALISIAKRVFNYDVHGFTIVNSDGRYDEKELVDLSAKELGVRHTEVPVTSKDFMKNLRNLVVSHQAPIVTITYYAHWLLMEAVKSHGYRISVSGTGADELFSGYYDHHLFYLASIKNETRLHAQSVANWEQRIKPIVRNPFLQNPDAFVNQPNSRDHLILGADDFSSWLKKPWQERFVDDHYCEDILRNRMMNEVFHENVPPILHEDDLNAMYYSIENRSPFLDRKLFETAYSIPTRHLVKDGYAKYVLRAAMRGIVPDAVLDDHRKVGFNAPILSFLDVTDANVRNEVLADSPIFDMIKRDKIEKLMSRPELPNSASKFLFNFLCAKFFLEGFETEA